MKMTEEKLREIAEKYCNDKTPLSKLALEYGVSKSTLVRYFEGERTIKLDSVTQDKVNEVKKENWDNYKSTSGNLNHKAYDSEYIVSLAKKMVDNELSLQELSELGNIPKSTIFSLFTESLLGEELYAQIMEQYSINKERKGRK